MVNSLADDCRVAVGLLLLSTYYRIPTGQIKEPVCLLVISRLLCLASEEAVTGPHDLKKGGGGLLFHSQGLPCEI